jgi:hypothetical protein
MERSGGAERTTLRNEPQPRRMMNYAPKSMNLPASRLAGSPHPRSNGRRNAMGFVDNDVRIYNDVVHAAGSVRTWPVPCRATSCSTDG